MIDSHLLLPSRLFVRQVTLSVHTRRTIHYDERQGGDKQWVPQPVYFTIHSCSFLTRQKLVKYFKHIDQSRSSHTFSITTRPQHTAQI
jgi:hypothetical protein